MKQETEALFSLEAGLPKSASNSILRKLFPAVESLLKFRAIDNLYQGYRSSGESRPIVEYLLDRLNVTVEAASSDLARIPVKGPVVITVNHPFGLLDPIVLTALLRRIRPDVKFLANRFLAKAEELHEFCLLSIPSMTKAPPGQIFIHCVRRYDG